MKTVLPQNTGPIEWGGVWPTILLAIGVVLLLLLFAGAIASMTRPRTRGEPPPVPPSTPGVAHRRRRR